MMLMREFEILKARYRRAKDGLERRRGGGAECGKMEPLPASCVAVPIDVPLRPRWLVAPAACRVWLLRPCGEFITR